MPSYDANLYYHPEHSGLKTVGELEYSSGSYEFDTRVVWFEASGNRLLTARDSGCSCPTPFEDETLDTVEDITHRYATFLMDEWRKEHKGYRGGYVTRAEVDDLIAACREKLI